MKKLPLLVLGAVLLCTSGTPSYAAPPPEAGAAPDADALLKKMSTRLASTKQYRFTASRTMPGKVAKASGQPARAEVAVVVARPNRLAAKFNSKEARREMLYDGKTFTIVDGINNFYSTAPLSGSLDQTPAQLAKIYGFQPPLGEFILSDPYRDIKYRTQSITYLGKDSVRQGGQAVQCHRIGLHGKLADSELWLGVDDNLPRRLKVYGNNSAGKSLLADFEFLSWDMNPQLSGSAFRHQPTAGAQKIPMITLAEANAARE